MAAYSVMCFRGLRTWLSGPASGPFPDPENRIGTASHRYFLWRLQEIISSDDSDCNKPNGERRQGPARRSRRARVEHVVLSINILLEIIKGRNSRS